MRPEILFPLFAPVRSLPGVGPKIGQLIASFAGETLAALCRHLPSGVIDWSFRPKISELQGGRRATLDLIVDRHTPPPPIRRNLPYRIACHDESGRIELVFFRAQSDYLLRILPPGARRYVSGTVEFFNDRPRIVHPDHILSEEEFAAQPEAEPVYPLTAGLSGRIVTRTIRHALERCPDLPEWQDPAWLKQQHWPSWQGALRQAHAPRSEADLDARTPSRLRLAYDELLANQLALGLTRQWMRSLPGRAFPPGRRLKAGTLAALPFTLTGAQQRCLSEIAADMARPAPMLRLLQGDVGSGKTVVAFLAMLDAVEAGAQAAIMAPTEILARQHAATLAPLARSAGLTLKCLTGNEKGKARSEILDALADGSCHILAGTHSLFQKDAAFRDLGFCVIDEQHRFGVHQRLALSSKGRGVDVLVMTATPIPRTLALTVYGDMEVSRLDEKPPGQKPVRTSAIPVERLDEVIEAVRRAQARGERIYWVCPLIEAGDVSARAVAPLSAALERREALSKALPCEVGLVHGRMKTEDKDKVLTRFQSGEAPVLVATTVVEVGIDVPEASVMVIEHAERFGLAQLHQLRGRVGRGRRPAACLLLYRGPLGEAAKARLSMMRASNDGFRIAEEDLRLRGGGEMLGTRQSGLPEFRLADPSRHADLLVAARDDAAAVLEGDPFLKSARGEALRVLLYLFSREEAVRYLRSG